MFTELSLTSNSSSTSSRKPLMQTFLKASLAVKAVRSVGWAPWFMWLLGAILYGYQFVLRVSPSVMVTDLMQAFAVDAQSLGILSAFYYYAYATFQLPIGMVLDKFGPRRVLTFSALMLALGAYIFSMADSLYFAQLGRFLIGAGAAGVFLGTLKVITLWFPHYMFSILSSFTVVIGTIGAMNGGAPMSLLIGEIGWRSSLRSLSILGLGMALTIVLVVKNRKNAADTLEASHLPKPKKLVSELRDILANGQTWIIAVYGICTYVVLSSFSDLWCIPYLQAAYDIDLTLASAINSSIYLGLAMGGPFFAFLSEILKSRRIPMYSSALAIFLILCVILYARVPVYWLFGIIFLLGFFVGGKILCFPAACEINPPSVSGTTLGFINMFCMGSGMVFQPLLGFMIKVNWDGTMEGGIPYYSAQNYVDGLSTLPICLAIAVAMGILMKETYTNRDRADDSPTDKEL